MDPRLSSLIELQNTLTIQRNLEAEYQAIPQRRNEINDILQKMKEEAQRAEERIKQHEIEVKSKELELQANQETRVKKEAQLLSIKSEKEYQATNVEIESIDRKNRRVEERTIELIDLIEKERKTAQSKQDELKAKESSFEKELLELDKRGKSLTKILNKAKSDTQQLQETINPNLFHRFIRVFDNKQRFAVVPANDGHCGGCSIRLTPRLLQLVKRGQDIVICEACQRFLYWDSTLDEDQLGSL